MTDKAQKVFVQFTIICLSKDNYLKWSTAITMEIAGRGRFASISGRKPRPAKTESLVGHMAP